MPLSNVIHQTISNFHQIVHIIFLPYIILFSILSLDVEHRRVWKVERRRKVKLFLPYRRSKTNLEIKSSVVSNKLIIHWVILVKEINLNPLP